MERYKIPPTRDIIFLAGYASMGMMPRKGLYCENMPSQDCEKNLCPFLLGAPYDDCPEFQKGQKQMENLQKKAQLKFQNKSKRQAIPREIRKQIAAECRYKCVYCGAAQNSINPDGNKVKCVVDHFIPLAQGGHPTDPSNLVLACTKCNREKGVDFWPREKKLQREEYHEGK